MKRHPVLILGICFLMGAFSASAQVTAPAKVKKRFLAEPSRAATGLRDGPVAAPYSADHWYKGNTHCHSDTDGERIPKHGDGPPEATLQWYADHGYDFVALTDHNYFHEGLIAPAGLLYIQSEEITSIRYHVNALGNTGYIRPAFGEGKLTIYQRAIDDTLAQGGLPVLNHPVTPMGYCFPAEFKQLTGLRHFEVYNMQPGNYSRLGEPLWDNLLTDGYLFYGMITDDAHKFVRADPLIGDPPGGGWIMVDAAECTQEKILDAVREGKFYGSTGVSIERYEVSAEGIEVWVDTAEPCAIEFIGAFGKVLQSETGDHASYKVAGGELYVRVRVTNPEGKLALMQPVFYK